jgi:hypothetical protein
MEKTNLNLHLVILTIEIKYYRHVSCWLHSFMPRDTQGFCMCQKQMNLTPMSRHNIRTKGICTADLSGFDIWYREGKNGCGGG